MGKRKPLRDTPARWRAIEQKFGLSKEDYHKILREQNGVCFICERSPYQIRPRKWLAVDHSHSEKTIRGLLCGSCNHRLLGYIIKDNVRMAERLVKYLKKRKHYGKVPNS